MVREALHLFGCDYANFRVSSRSLVSAETRGQPGPGSRRCLTQHELASRRGNNARMQCVPTAIIEHTRFRRRNELGDVVSNQPIMHVLVARIYVGRVRTVPVIKPSSRHKPITYSPCAGTVTMRTSAAPQPRRGGERNARLIAAAIRGPELRKNDKRASTGQ